MVAWSSGSSRRIRCTSAGSRCSNWFTFVDVCVSPLRGGHANLPCIVPILTDDPRRECNVVLPIGSIPSSFGLSMPSLLPMFHPLVRDTTCPRPVRILQRRPTDVGKLCYMHTAACHSNMLARMPAHVRPLPHRWTARWSVGDSVILLSTTCCCFV